MSVCKGGGGGGLGRGWTSKVLFQTSMTSMVPNDLINIVNCNLLQEIKQVDIEICKCIWDSKYIVILAYLFWLAVK